MAFNVPEKYRVDPGPQYEVAVGNNGAFMIPVTVSRKEKGAVISSQVFLRIIASDGAGWEHVSVSLPDRIPSWQEMCLVKNLFWGDEDIVMQLHPAKSDYINNHHFCLHLWRPTNDTIPTPPSVMVGIKSGETPNAN